MRYFKRENGRFVELVGLKPTKHFAYSLPEIIIKTMGAVSKPKLIRRFGPALVEEFAGVRNEIGILDRREKDLNAFIKAEMTSREISEYAPDRCPYKLILNRTEQHRVEWEAEWDKLAAEVWGAKWLKYKEALKLAAPAKEVLRLSVEPNA